MKKYCNLLMLIFSAIVISTLSVQAGVIAPERLDDGIVVAINGGFLKVEVCSEDVIRIAYAKDSAFFSQKSLAAKPKITMTPWKLKNGARETSLTTSKIQVRIDRSSGVVAFFDSAGRPILSEKKGGRTITPADVQGEKTFHVRQEWEPPSDEALYGLGQNQLGLLNIKGYDLDLWQHNGTVIVPFLVSSRGYGIFWDNPSYTRFGDLRDPEVIPSARLYDATGKPGGLTGSYYAGANFERLIAKRVDAKIDIQLSGNTKDPNKLVLPDLPRGDLSIRWEGEIEPDASGDYTFQTFSSNGIKVWVNDQLIINHWRQNWLPWINLAKMRLEAKRRYRIRIEWTRDQGAQTMRLLWKTPATRPSTSLWSEVGDGIDYYFVYGPDIDKVVARYRRITGEAPMMPSWAFGLWQSRQRYKTAQESLDVLEGFRSRRIPIDNIVQDWFYWKEDAWGSHEFDPARFPDPGGWIRSIHDKYHARLMISVWGKFYPGTENFNAMRSRGFLYELNLKENLHDWINHPYTFYDAFNPEARKLFWSQVERELLPKGVDAWWMDATEPDLMPTPTLEGQHTHVHPTALGTGARVLNAYSLVNSEGVYEGQRTALPNQRVFILTRSGYSGQQRYAAATWSGDISSTWTAMRAQIPAGLGFSVSGIPYWTMDIGGFSVPPRFSRENPTPEDTEEWRELNTRWFQFGTFCPLLRVHGESPNREMWFMGGESHPAYQTHLKFDRLRYRMLPYIYSLSAAVTRESGTIMRALIFDFRTDKKVQEITDEYMFGQAFLVCPVSTYKARSRSVYLPASAGWYDFWNGAMVSGGKTIDAAAPLESMPLFVKAGSIIPFGPEIQYTSEKAADPITLYIYTGADGSFSLYEDEGLNYNYEKGAFTRIPIQWSEAKRMLTIGKREGSFPGMLNERTFEVVLISKNKPVGFSFTPRSDRKIKYKGETIEVRLD